MARVKGAALREFLLYCGPRLGHEGIVSIVSSLPPELAGAFDRDRDALGVLDSNWYPAAAVHALLDGLESRLGAVERAAFAREAARAVLAQTLRGVYRWLFRTMMTPERYAKRAQSLWDRYYDTGKIEKTVIAPNEHRTIIGGWAAHHPLLCDFHVASAEFLYEAMGCRDVVATRTSCVSRGAPTCVFDVKWT